jgi:CheY-like chemotaxis protein
LAKILVVDDDPAMRITVRLLLERAGHEVVVATDGQKGLAACAAGGCDLLLLDIFMPHMDGFETMRQIRIQHPTVPIIVMSGHSRAADAAPEPDYLAMATKLGALVGLTKPFKPSVLLAIVEDCLRAMGHRSISADRTRDVASSH